MSMSTDRSRHPLSRMSGRGAPSSSLHDSGQRLTDEEVLALGPAIREFLVAAGVLDEVEDLVQETLTRLFEVRDRLEPATVGAYAITTARHLSISEHRQRRTAHRNQHRLFDPSVPDDPHEHAVSTEERAAMARALALLPAQAREALLLQLDRLGPSPTPAAVRARSARGRAAARVNYVVSMRRQTLPSTRCRPVLMAVSAGDLKRQTALRAGEHLLECAACADLAEPLARRDRRLVALVPFPLLLGLKSVRKHALASAALVATCGVALAAGLLAVSQSPAKSESPPSVAAQVGGSDLALGAPARGAGPLAQPARTQVAGTVLFASGSSSLDAAAKQAIASAAQVLLARHATTVVVVGYTDSAATAELNRNLAQQRAVAVATRLGGLVGRGVAISVASAGEADPASSNATASGRDADRRVVITWLAK